jgi:nucleoside-diphosphate-sugar epimerase
LNIFLTGESGFVGKNFITYFNNSHKIRPYLRESNISISEEIVVHFAGKAHDLKKTSKPEDYYNINTKLTKNGFDSFLY